MNVLQKFALKKLIKKSRKRIKKAKLAKSVKKYQKSILQSKKALVDLMKVIEIDDDHGKPYSEQRIYDLSNTETEVLFESVMVEMEKLIR